jgi:cyclase
MRSDGNSVRRAGNRALLPQLTSRRDLLHGALAGTASLTLGFPLLFPPAARAQPRAAGVGSAAVGANLQVLTAGGSNVLALTGAEGVVLVDGGSAATSAELLRAVAGLSGGGRVHTLFNTHWHPEQTGSNAALAAAGAAIVAQENTRLWLSTDVTWPWSGETVQPLPPAARPSKGFYAQEQLEIGGVPIRYGHLPDAPHTDGDSYVLFPEQNVLAVGGALNGDGWQLPDWWTGGWIGGAVGGLEHLLLLADANTRIVPAHGPVLTRAQLEEQYQIYSVVWERLAQLLYTGRGPDEAVAARPTREFDAKMGQPDEFVARSFRSLWAYLTPDA